MRFGHDRHGDGHSRQANHAVHEGYELWHFGHLDPFGDHNAKRATNHEPKHNPAQASDCTLGAR